jgi:formyltetrahydrofolate deformylase
MTVAIQSPKKRIISLTVIGRDRTGVIAAFTNLLFQKGANIEALAEEVRSGQFSMTLQASWPISRFAEKSLRADIAILAQELKMEASVRILNAHRKQRMAILVTREAHALQGLLKAHLPCEIAFIAATEPDLRPVARQSGVPFVHIPWAKRLEAEKKLNELLVEHEVDFIVLARFMKILSPSFVWKWKNKIINIHPSLLPAFPGASAYRQAFEKGVRVIGVTSHIVTPGLDEGPILDQDSFRIGHHAKLADIVKHGQKLETKVLVSAVRLFIEQRFDIYWGRVHMNGSN